MIVEVEPDFPCSPYNLIPLGRGLFCKVDVKLYDSLSAYNWYAKKSFRCWYACRKLYLDGCQKIIRMHRIIANTPEDMVCHHINHDTFDNRILNLQNMLSFDHAKMFSWR